MPFSVQPFPDVLTRRLKPVRHRDGPLLLHDPQVTARLLEQSIQALGQADRQQPGPLCGSQRGVEGIAGQLPLQHQFSGDLLVFDIEVQAADQGVDRVFRGPQHVLVPGRVVVFDQQ